MIHVILTLMDYSAWLTLALVGGLAITWLGARRAGLPPVAVFDAALVGLAAGVVGGRAGYVALNWSYFYEHLGEGLSGGAAG